MCIGPKLCLCKFVETQSKGSQNLLTLFAPKIMRSLELKILSNLFSLKYVGNVGIF